MIRACRIRRLGKTLDWWSANARLRTRAAEFVQAHTIASGFSQSHVFSQEFVWSAPTEVSNTIAGRFAREPCRLQSSRSAGRSEVYEPIWHTHIKQSGSQIRDIDSLLALLAWLTHIEDSSLGRNGPAQNAGLAR